MKTNLLFLGLIVLMISCGPSNSSQNEKEGTPEETPSEPVKKYPETALAGMFQVDDVDQWTSVYNREVPSENRIGTLQSLENPNLIFVMQWSENHESSKQLVEAEDTRAVMEEGTLSSDPQFYYYDIKYFDDQTTSDSFRLAVTAEVLNYKMWKADFDRDEFNREDAGLRLRGLATDSENENLVYIMFSTNDQQKAYEFLGAEETKNAISESGVIGEPNTSWWRVIR